jgi:mono/diheme cytochrome c family protein
MKKIFGIVVLMFLLAVMSACNNEKPAEEPANAPAIEPAEEETTEPADEKDSAPAEETDDQASVGTDTVVAGDEVFQKSCITCHSSGDIAGGQGMIDGAKIHTDFSTQEDLLTFVSEKMPKTAPGSLSEEEYEAVANFLWDQK